MKKYVIYSPHKCGSTVLARILSDIFNFPEKIRMNQEKSINNDTGSARLRFERHIRLQGPDNIDLTKDRVIFIPRNPIGIVISMFYSFGYTHPTPPKTTSEQWKQVQQDIQNSGLLEYIDDHIEASSTKIQRCWNWPINNKIILPYELMVSNFKLFLTELLQSLDMMSVYDTALKKWERSFSVIEDRSSLIESGKMKCHKRTTDIYEWKTKLSKETQARLLGQYPFVQQYDDYLRNIL